MQKITPVYPVNHRNARVTKASPGTTRMLDPVVSCVVAEVFHRNLRIVKEWESQPLLHDSPRSEGDHGGIFEICMDDIGISSRKQIELSDQVLRLDGRKIGIDDSRQRRSRRKNQKEEQSRNRGKAEAVHSLFSVIRKWKSCSEG